MNINTYLNELGKIPSKFRKRVEVFVIFKDRIIAGENPRWNKMLQAPGGGVEKGQTLEKAAIQECLEELGILIENPKLISKKTLKVDWYSQLRSGQSLPQKIVDRMRDFRGSEIFFMYAMFKKVDRRHYGRDNDPLIPRIVTATDLIKEYKLRATRNPTFREANNFRAEILQTLKDELVNLL
jgi:8-oxo-dGTP pyrophosphatase MutT (NUDIX family)